MDAFQLFYRETAPRLERKLEAYNQKFLSEEQAFLSPIGASMADLNAGGKLLRGVLVDLGYALSGKADGDISDSAAMAFEMFQTGVLIHDDITDRATFRRGKKTIHVRYEESLNDRHIVPPTSDDTSSHLSEGVAIFAGDCLIAEANLLLAEAYEGHAQAAKVMAYFNKVILNTYRGELLDIVLPGEISDPNLSEDDRKAILMEAIYTIYHLKTAQYSVVGPLHLGMLLGDMPEDEMAAVDAMADDLGVAFQIKDDILGIYGDEDKLGKDVGSDISEYKQTILYAYVRLYEPEAWETLKQYYGRAKLTAEDLTAVRRLLDACGAKAYAEDAMETCFARAEEKLRAIHSLNHNHSEILRAFIDYMRKREK